MSGRVVAVANARPASSVCVPLTDGAAAGTRRGKRTHRVYTEGGNGRVGSTPFETCEAQAHPYFLVLWSSFHFRSYFALGVMHRQKKSQHHHSGHCQKLVTTNGEVGDVPIFL